MTELLVKYRLWLILALTVLIGFAGFGGSLDEQGEAYADRALKRALISYGVARGINGVVSVVQGTEVALQPAGVGLTLTPGQILDPVNDLVERFSWVVLVATVSLGVQKFLIELSSSWGITVLTLGFLLGSLLLYFYTTAGNNRFARVLYILTVSMLFFRFSIPFIAMGNNLLYEHFLEKEYEEYTQELEQTQRAVTELSQKDKAEDYGQSQPEGGNSIVERASKMFSSISSSVNINEKIERFQQQAEVAIRNMVNLIIVFALETIIFPVIFFWLWYKLAALAIRQIRVTGE